MTFVDRIARIRIELDGTDPSIWRRIEVPLTTSLKGLHELIQAVMLFENYHLFQFEVGDKRYGIPDPEWDLGPATIEAKNIKLGALVERGVGAFPPILRSIIHALSMAPGAPHPRMSVAFQASRSSSSP